MAKRAPDGTGSRPMTGFWVTLTAEQRARILARTTEDNFGADHLARLDEPQARDDPTHG